MMFEVKPFTAIEKNKWDESSLEGTSGAMITRNGQDFYFVNGTMDYSINKAKLLITKYTKKNITKAKSRL